MGKRESDVKKGKRDGKETSVDEGKERITGGNDVWTSFYEGRNCQPYLVSGSFGAIPLAGNLLRSGL